MDYNKVYSKVHLKEAADRNYNSVLFFMHLWCENPQWDNGFAKYQQFCSDANKFHKKLKDDNGGGRDFSMPRDKKGEMTDVKDTIWAKWPLDHKCPLGCANIDCMEWYFWAASYAILEFRSDLDAKKPPTYDNFLSAYFARVEKAYVDAEIAKSCFYSNVSVVKDMLTKYPSYATEGILDGKGHDNVHWLEDKHAESIAKYIKEVRGGELPKNLDDVSKILKEMKSVGSLKSPKTNSTGEVKPNKSKIISFSEEDNEKFEKEQEEKKHLDSLERKYKTTSSFEEFKEAVCGLIVKQYGPFKADVDIKKIFDIGYKAHLNHGYDFELYTSENLPEDVDTPSRSAMQDRVNFKASIGKYIEEKGLQEK